LNNLRTRLCGIAFGDQGQFVRSEAIPLMGGFPTQMLMEDVELSMRLKEVGRVGFLGKGIVVSDRRWERQPFAANICLVLGLLCRYLFRRRLWRNRNDALEYYKSYYGDWSHQSNRPSDSLLGPGPTFSRKRGPP
jgi:hypothetical protein